MAQVVPNGWVCKPLNKIIEPRGEKVTPSEYGDMPFLGMDHVEPHSSKILGSVPSSSMKSKAAKFYADDVLYGRLRPYLNKVALPPFEGLASAEFIVFPSNKVVDTKFLKYRLGTRDFVSFASHLNEGDRPRVNFDQIGPFEILLPPEKEQHRIVAKIEELFSELDKGIESLKTARAQLKVYRQALLKHAFEGKLTEQWRKDNAERQETAEQLLERIKQEREARYQQQLDEWKAAVKQWEANGKEGKKPSKPQKHKTVAEIHSEEYLKLPSIPKEWEYIRFGALIDTIDAGKSFKCDEREPLDSEVGVAKVSAVTWGEYDQAESKTCLDPEKVVSQYFIRKGDFLMSRANTIELVGAAVIVRHVSKSVMLSDKTLRISMDNSLKPFALYYLRSRTGRKEIMSRSTGNQESMRNIGQDRIRSICLPICSEIEIGKIVDLLDEKLSVVHEQIQDIDVSLSKSEALRQSILKKAFSGQLVLQDPNDEPASVLLERIAKEKEEAAVKAKKAKTANKKQKPRKSAAKVLPFKARISGISTTDLHAGILALAYRQHKDSEKALQSFGHVKGEKIAHLVEAHLGIDLGRKPVKNAAGPNDYPHLMKVESRARKAGFFDVKRFGARYVMQQGRQFDAVVEKASDALGPLLADVDSLLALMKPLNTRQAEIVATLYAAWNNLLLAGDQPDDEAILTEARENWHQDKLKIERDKFFRGLGWMRKKGLVPQGKGEKVVAKSGKQD